jgi:hypothetical protein
MTNINLLRALMQSRSEEYKPNRLVYFFYVTPCMFLQSTFQKKNALHETINITRIKTATCFGTPVPSSKNYYDKCIQANNLCFVHSYKIK